MIRKRVSAALVAACLSTGLLWAADPAPPSFPQGFVTKELNDQQDVRAVMASATNAALTKGGFNDLLERLSSADRKRFADAPKQDTAELDGRITQIQKIWKEKYGKAFDLNDDKLLNEFVVIREGEISDPAVAKMHWPVLVLDRTEGEAMKASSAGSGNYLVKGRNVAIVTIPASHGKPAMNISMLHEPVDDWRIDISDQISRDMIFNNLKDRLTYFGENVDKWPSDVNEAYRGMAHCVMAAVCNVPRVSDPVKRADDAPFPR